MQSKYFENFGEQNPNKKNELKEHPVNKLLKPAENPDAYPFQKRFMNTNDFEYASKDSLDTKQMKEMQK